MLKFLDIFFFVFHTALIIFNIAGWAFRKTRRWNLVTLVLTGLSWFALGAWYGWGYCPFTDWHWDVRRELGVHDMSHSYNHFLILKLTGLDLDVKLVDYTTVIVFFASLAASVYVNTRRKASGRV